MTAFETVNRYGLTIRGEVRMPAHPSGLAFVQHGLSGSRRQPHMIAMAECLVGAGYATVFFDSTHSFGQSGGDLRHVTQTTHMHDLEDVVAWAEKQAFYRAPFLLMGHSLGGISVLHYAVSHPDKVSALAPLATVLSGRLSEEAPREDPDFYRRWEEKGWYEKENSLNPGEIGRVSWALALDRRKYDLLARAHEITAPVLLCVGDRDESTPLAHQKLLYDKLTGPKRLEVIAGCAHTPKSEAHLQSLKDILARWLKDLPAP